MDAILCDELLQEILQRLPPSSSSAVSLVSKRWLRLLRFSTASLSLRFAPHHLPGNLFLSSFLSHYPFLSSLYISTVAGMADPSDSADQLLLSVSSSCPNLRHLRFFTGPISFCPLLSLSTSCPHLFSLTITLSRPLSFRWLLPFLNLRDLSIFFAGSAEVFDSLELDHKGEDYAGGEMGNLDAELQIESLCLSGIQPGDYGLRWLWRSCKKLKKLRLRSCEGVGDTSSFSSSLKCLQAVELRTCRTIVDGVLLKLAQNCSSLNSLLIYDGGSKEGLLQFLIQSRCNLQELDLRLPLDLDNDHLLAVAENFRELLSLRLQSCCLVTGEGLKRLAVAMNGGLEELALINCDVVEREPGLLTALAQNLSRLRKLDLSYNEMLADKELILMLASCRHLNELNVRGCGGLTNAAVVSMARSCKQLQSINIMYCSGIEAHAVESLLVLCSPKLRRVQVEQAKLSDAARAWASNKLIEVVV